MIEVAQALLALGALWGMLSLWFGVPMRMAKARGRDPGHWALISLFGSPVLAIVLLLALDEKVRPNVRTPNGSA